MKNFIYSLVFLLYGCAVPLQKQETALDNATTTYTSMSEFDYLRIPAQGEIIVEIYADSPVFIFNGRKRYFRAFELPQGNKRILYIKSYFNGIFIGQYLNPVVLQLDKSMKIIEESKEKSLLWNGEYFGDTNAHMKSVHVMDDKTRYIVIYGAEKLASDIVEVEVMPTVINAGNVITVSPGGVSRNEMEQSPTGKLRMWIQHYKL